MVSSSGETRKKRERNTHILMGPNTMLGFDRQQMFISVISWILYWGSEHREFDVAITWVPEFRKYLCGFTTQDEEDWLDERCSTYYIDLTGRRRDLRYIDCSKSFSQVLRHNKRTYLFSERGRMNIADLFDQMGWQNPKQYNMSGAQFAAFLLRNPKQRFFVDIHMQWEWYPYSSAATYPFYMRLGCVQGHSNQVADPYSTHHPLTYGEAMCLGLIFHVTDSANVPSIQQYGLKTDVKGSGRGGRDAVHFMYHNDNGQGYIRMAEGTTPPRQYRQPVYCVLDPQLIESQQLFLFFLTKNGVVLFHGDIPAEFRHLQDQLPTLACNVPRPGRGHMQPPSVTGGTWPADVSYGHVPREKRVDFAPGRPIPETIRTTAWQFMGQEIPPNDGKLVFGFPLTSEVDFDPGLESVHGLLLEGSQQREESEQNDQHMQSPYDI